MKIIFTSKLPSKLLCDCDGVDLLEVLNVGALELNVRLCLSL